MTQCCAAMSALQATGSVRSIFSTNEAPSTSQSKQSLAFSSRTSQLSGTQLVASTRQSVSHSGRAAKLVVRAEGEEKAQESEGSNFGLGGPGTWFGFGSRQERNVGRLAMMGFASGLVMEVVTGKGVLGQLGINPSAVRVPLLAGLAFLFIGGLLGGYVVINNPPNFDKAPPNAGAGLPRNPLKTYDPQTPDRLTTYTRGGVVDRPGGSKGREPYVSDLKDK